MHKQPIDVRIVTKMRAKKPFLIASFLCTWSIISYLLLIRQTDSGQDARRTSHKLTENRRQRDDILKQLNRLESNIYEENELHDDLVKKLIEIVRLKDTQNGVGAAQPNKIAVPADTYERYAVKDGDGSVHEINAIEKNVIVYDSKDVANKIDSLDTANGAKNAPKLKHENPTTETSDEQGELIERLRALNRPPDEQKGPTIPVIVFACNRISVRNCLDDLVRYRPNSHQFPIIVSQVSLIRK